MATTRDLLPPPQLYRTPVLRIVGPLWRALHYAHDGNLLHDKNARLTGSIASCRLLCSRCGSNKIEAAKAAATPMAAEEEQEQQQQPQQQQQQNEKEQQVNGNNKGAVQLPPLTIADPSPSEPNAASSHHFRCRDCGCKNPWSFLSDQHGQPIGLGSILLCGPHKAPCFVVEMNRGAHTIEALFVAVTGRVALQQQTLIGVQQRTLLKKASSESRWSPKSNGSGGGGTLGGERGKQVNDEDVEEWVLKDAHARVLTDQRVDDLDEDDAVTLRRLVMALAEFSVCGMRGAGCHARTMKRSKAMHKAESVFHLQSDILARSDKDLMRAFKSVPSLEYSLRGMRVQKESYVEKLHELTTFAVAALPKGDGGEEGGGESESGDGVGNLDLELSMPLADLRAPARNLEERIALKKKIEMTQGMITTAEARLHVAQKVKNPIILSCPRCGWGGGICC